MASDRRPAREGQSGPQVWHFYFLLSMVAATAAVVLSRNAHPMALLLLSAGAIAAGSAAFALHRALAGFLGRAAGKQGPLSERTRDALLRDKMLVLRSIKELEFDHSMGKVGEADYRDILGRLRARALVLMQDLERVDRTDSKSASEPAARQLGSQDLRCQSCGTMNDPDARYCKQCGQQLT